MPFDRFVQWDGECPDCGANHDWDLGPQNGAHINMRCVVCRCWINVTMVEHPALPLLAHRVTKER